MPWYLERPYRTVEEEIAKRQSEHPSLTGSRFIDRNAHMVRQLQSKGLGVPQDVLNALDRDVRAIEDAAGIPHVGEQ